MSLPSFLRCLILAISLHCGLFPAHFVDAISLSSSGSSVSLDGIPYFIPPYSSGKLSLDEVDFSGCVSVNGMYPITLLSNVTAESDFKPLIESFMAQDDVFQTGFMQSMLNQKQILKFLSHIWQYC